MLALAACAGPSPLGEKQKGQRIVSTNPCLDAILVDLVPPERIAAISRYSHDPRASSMPVELARRFRAVAGTAEEVIALKPDLVLASSFTPPATLAAYRRLGFTVAIYGTAPTIAENRAQVAEIARRVGEPQRGAALIGRIDRAVARAAPLDASRPSALVWLGGSNLVNGGGTLIHDLMRHAGFRNASADYGVRNTGILPLELVVERPPRLVLTPAASDGADEAARRTSLRARALGRTTMIAEFPQPLSWCGGPTIIPAMERLAAARRRISS